MKRSKYFWVLISSLMFVPAKDTDQYTELCDSWTYNKWSWLLAPGEYGMRVMLKCCGDLGFPLGRHNTRELLYVIKSLAIHEVDVACKAGSADTVHDVSSAPEDLVEEFAGHAVSSTATDRVEEGAGHTILGAPTDTLEESEGHVVPSVASIDRLVEAAVSLMDTADSTKKADHHPASDPPPANGPTAGAPEDQLNPSAECATPWWKDLMMPLPLSCESSGRTYKFPNPKVVVLDMNGVLLKRYNSFPKGKALEQLPKGHKFTIRRVVKGEYARGVTCIVRPDAQNFISHCASMFIPVLWSSCTEENLTATMVSFFSALHPKVWGDILSQQHCRQAPFKLSEVPGVKTSEHKPIFLKVDDDLRRRHPEWQTLKILFVDDTRYKNQLNSMVSMICPPSFDPFDPQQDEYYLTNTLLPWLRGWCATDDPDAYVLKNMLKNDKDMVSSHVMKHWEMLKSC